MCKSHDKYCVNLLKKYRLARFTLLHEIGHHINRDLNNKDFTAETYDEDRVAAVKQGRVLDFELKADAFACSYLGSDYIIKALEQLKAYGDETEQGKLFISEIELRIQALHRLTKFWKL